jgi:hypothetical protein
MKGSGDKSYVTPVVALQLRARGFEGLHFCQRGNFTLAQILEPNRVSWDGLRCVQPIPELVLGLGPRPISV